MGEWLRVLFAVAICGGFAFFMIANILQGLASGKMSHSDSRRFADRRKQPLFFWFLFFVFSAFAAAALYVLYDVLRRVLWP
mgnify:FL=1